ncbi:carbohydrate ABC transporter membrane protein 1, CUT1 family [Kytococcus aerolatus]|uniref:Maltose/maltodextrin transport system permease protein n=1 Tax=Kytococcus aerolatus TaxID=592308 RepID=A0A212U5R6_9MICO|nr:ABC transporter permease subunit [Kytococcus aerolatus]SNC73603.1 carbohydrate ABC transporter membrane protein 1, CUT1 family [Kytococcus aerolatus]
MSEEVSAGQPVRGEGLAEHGRGRRGGWGWTLVRWLLLAAVVAVAVVVVQRALDAGAWWAVVLAAFLATVTLAVYSTRRFVPMKYLWPGLVLLLGLQIWPLVYTVALSFTNTGAGHQLTKDETIEVIQASSVQQVEGSERYALSVAVPEGVDATTGDLVYLLTDPEGAHFAGTQEGLTELEEGVEATGAGKITAAPGYELLDPKEVNKRSKELSDFAVPVEGGGIKALGLSQAFLGSSQITYDEAADTLTDQRTGTVYVPSEDARWVPRDGEGKPLPQGWKQNVGLDNYLAVLKDDTLRGGFLSIFAWNVAFALLSVLTTFVLGLLLALLFNDERLRGKSLYRSLLILPYAIPVYVSALVWASMFNQDFGLVNDLTGLSVDWLGNPWAARAAILITNLWLGFPYMFIICTGALQAVPADVKEAAAVDGAGWWRTVWSITMPLILVAVGPLLIASFAFNFNNFGLIYLLTEGGPFVRGSTDIGSTDLLITYAYRLAFEGATPNFGLASAVAVYIFFIVAAFGALGFSRTKALEEVN